MAKKTLQKTVTENIAPRRQISFRMRLFQSYILIAFFSFILLAISAKLIPFYTWDLPVLRLIQSVTFPPLVILLSWASWAGFFPQALFLILIILSILWQLGLRWETVSLALTTAASSLLVEIFKIIVGRLRPANIAHVAQIIRSPSFPSGHVVSYTVILGFLLFLSQSLLKKTHLRLFFAIVFTLPILIVGPSRIYLGEHWPSDVLGAYLLGSGWLFLSILFYRWGKSRFFVRQPALPGSGGSTGV